MDSPDMTVWTGRDDTPTEGPNALRWWQCIKPYSDGVEPGIVLIGFACDEGVRRNGGRVGAKDGPRALRKSLANMAWHRVTPAYDAGDVTCVNREMEAAQDELATMVYSILKAGHRPLVLGGGHETAWGTFSGIAQSQTSSKIGIINIDSHLDTRMADCSHSGTPFSQVASWCKDKNVPFRYLVLGVSQASNTAGLIDRARSLGAVFFQDEQLSLQIPGQLPFIEVPVIREFIDECDFIHLSIDLDVLPVSAMPAVSSPAYRGVGIRFVEPIVDSILETGKLGAVDMVEFAPSLDIGNIGLRTASGLLWRIANSWPATSWTLPPGQSNQEK